MSSLLSFFVDPVLMAPTIGCMLMCFVGAVVGTFAVLKRQALVGEMLSHACYPGVIIALIILADGYVVIPLIGAAITSVLGMYLVEFLQSRFRVPADAALTFVLASFFGIGLTVLTALQNQMPVLYRQLQAYLFGQAATMTLDELYLYIGLTLLVLLTVITFYRLFKVTIFDPEFATVLGLNTALAQFLLVSLIVLSVVVGIRSLGVVLMSSMLIFPAVSARFWTHKLQSLLVLSAIFGLASGFFGVVISHTLSVRFHFSFPTGPACVIVASSLFFISALISPERGIIVRMVRAVRFWNKCQQENILKALYKAQKPLTRTEICELFQEKCLQVSFLLFVLKQKGLLQSLDGMRYELTPQGISWGRKIVRLHRLWEVYLVEYCGLAKDRVHPSAEEMEHIITKEIENELETLLRHPQKDPHHQPIPKAEEML